MMLGMGNLISQALSWFGGKVDNLSGTATKHPRGTAWVSLLGGAGALFGLKPEWLDQLGDLLKMISAAMQ